MHIIDLRRAAALLTHAKRGDGEGVDAIFGSAAVGGRLDELHAAMLAVAVAVADEGRLVALTDLFVRAETFGGPPGPTPRPSGPTPRPPGPTEGRPRRPDGPDEGR